MSKRKKEFQEEERKREERRNFLKWIGTGIAVAAVDGVLESRQVGLVRTIWRWIAERRDLYSRTTNQLKELGFSIDEANSIYFEDSKNIIVYLPDLHETDASIKSGVRKLERIIGSGLKLTGIGLEGILKTENMDEVQKKIRSLKNLENNRELYKYNSEIASANQEVTRLIEYFKERRAPEVDILHTNIKEIYDKVFWSLTYMLQVDTNPSSLTPGLQYPLKSHRLLEKGPIVFGLEQEKDYAEIIERGAVLDYLQAREAIQRWLNGLDDLANQIRENVRDISLQEEGIATIDEIRQRMTRYNAEFDARIERLSDKYHIPTEHLQSSMLYDNIYFNDLVVKRSKNWIRTIQEKAGKKIQQVYLIIGGKSHIPSVKDAAIQAKVSIITIDYTK